MNNIFLKVKISSIILIIMVFLSACNSSSDHNSNYINISSRAELFQYFRYFEHRATIISGHRGGMALGYPENCIESFEKTLSLTESFFEIDPRLTKDSVIVLMHDATLDRTTTGSGYVKDYTYQELQELFLKDRDGHVTEYKIPTLEQCINWSKGKTILNLDLKDVPINYMSDFINGINPPNVMYTVHNADQAQSYLSKDSLAMFSCWCKTISELEAYANIGLNWKQMMAYIGAARYESTRLLCEKLHSFGIMCMISVAPTHDSRLTDKERIAGYKLELLSNPDVIETDYPYLFQNLNLSK